LDDYMNKCKVFAEQSNSINFVRFEPPAIHTVNDSPLIHSAFLPLSSDQTSHPRCIQLPVFQSALTDCSHTSMAPT
jgi:hypothetical protein